MAVQYACGAERRRAEVRSRGVASGINGIDYLEVAEDQKVLTLRFVHPLPGDPAGVPAAPPLARENLRIEGGVRVTGIRVESVAAVGDTLEVRVSAAGDYSTYTLRLVRGAADTRPPDGFDPALSAVPFSFKVDCPSPFDCAPTRDCPLPALAEPRIDYLAKDYASFRRLMLDRLSVTMPDWQERNPADLGIALVEVLAYAADYLSYYQDAVGTEAYLGTARRRVSVRRHARMLDYPMHDGCSARTWAWLEIEAGQVLLPRGTPLLTRVEGLDLPGMERRIRPGTREHGQAVAARPVVFETMEPAALYAAHNEIPFYTWSDEECCLPRGAVRATLKDDPARRLMLRVGDVLVLEERRGPGTGSPADADLTRRHAVRLTRVEPEAVLAPAGDGARLPGTLLMDPLDGTAVCEVEWHPQDALPFSLCLSAMVAGQYYSDMSIARGNLVLADHGATIPMPEPLEPAVVPPDRRYYPRLQGREISQAVPFDAEAARGRAAGEALVQDARQALPQVRLPEADGGDWDARRDLLRSGRFSRDFVAEMEEDGRATLRFGDGILGAVPQDGMSAVYRTGRGKAGNLGANALYHVVTDLGGILAVSNPIPAQGGEDPEPLEAVRLYAPQAFRSQERAVTEADYAAAAQRHPEVQAAAATLRWTGSWHTMFVTVDRRHGRPVDAGFEAEMRAHLERFRLASYDLEVDTPRYVPLDVAFTVCVAPRYFQADVMQALLRTFGTGDLPGGGRGFFHPDNLTFGQPVYLSRLIAAAMEVPGVAWVDPIRFHRWGRAPGDELAEGRIALDRLEIARLDNDPNRQENGRLELVMEGGL